MDPQVIAVRVESKLNTFSELVDAARREQGTISVGVSGGGTGTGRLAFHLIERATGAKFRYVAYKGGGESVLATLGGHVEVTSENMSEMLPLVEAKKMRVLAVAGERRFVQAPDIPTARELGSSGSTRLDKKSAFVKCRTAVQGFDALARRIVTNTRCAAWAHARLFSPGCAVREARSPVLHPTPPSSARRFQSTPRPAFDT